MGIFNKWKEEEIWYRASHFKLVDNYNKIVNEKKFKSRVNENILITWSKLSLIFAFYAVGLTSLVIIFIIEKVINSTIMFNTNILQF